MAGENRTSGGPSGGGIGGVAPADLFGPSGATRRDVAVPYRWAGLAPLDHAVLVRFMGELGLVPDEFHTNVPVGGSVEPLPADYFARIGKMVAALYPRRIDAALRWGTSWWLVECKPDSAMHGLGQCLGYYFWWHRDVPAQPVSRVILACGSATPDEVAVYAACGVDVAVV